MIEPDSISLLRRHRAGDEEALAVLIERYMPRVLRIVRSRLGRELRAKLEVEDVVQVVMLRAVESLDHFEFNEDAALIRWMSKVAENEILQQARALSAAKRDVRREFPMDALDSGSGGSSGGVELASESVGPASKLVAQESAEIVDSCLRSLPSSYREVILVRDYAGGSWALVAEEICAPSVGAAKQLHQRALARLTSEVERSLG